MPRAAALIALSLAGCVTAIRPPAAPADPVGVAIVDYGYHASLILPLPGGGAMEYAYGEWNWFALNLDRWYHAIPALCWPTRGTLGRRRHASFPRRGGLSSQKFLEFRVERARAEALAAALDERYGRNAATEVFNPVNGLTFVHDECDYWCLANCNHVLAAWLRELGCDVGGSACFSSFRIGD